MTTSEIHDMIMLTEAGDTDRILDILLEMLKHIEAHERSIGVLAEAREQTATA